VRRRIEGDVLVDSARAELLYKTVGGAHVRLDRVPSTAGIHEMRLHVAESETIVLLAEERTRQPFGGAGTYLGLRFCAHQDQDLAKMTTALFTASSKIDPFDDAVGTSSAD
jgi:hypothetical protein